MTSAETFRAREVYRYYQPKNLADVPKASPSLERDFTNHVLPHADNFTTQQSFSDTALTAFTQLIALRLASQRAIVSLIDHENEYFLAESTSTLSLIDDEGPAQNAWLSISGARVPREKSLCEQTVRLVPNQDTTAEMTPWFLVPDLRLDEKTSKLDCVRGPPYLRFYCGVALTNKKGINIGCVYVVDDRARTDFSLEQAQFLTKMAATVMDHLENIRAKEDIVRVTMMSQALHAFIEGDGTMNGDWQRLKRYNLPAGAGVGFHWESNKNDGAGSYVNGKKELGSPEHYLSPDLEASHGHSPLQHTGTNLNPRYNFNNSPWSSSEEVPQVPLKSVFDGVEDAADALTGSRDTEFINSGFANLLHTTFSRASNLVREGMEVDGAVFFDAPFKFYQGRSTLETDTRRSGNQESESSNESEDDGHSDARPGPRPHVLPASHHTSRPSSRTSLSESRASPGTTTSMGLKSEILGYSTLNSSSWNNQTNSQITNFTAIDQSLLTSLVRRYPQGELFVFDQDGPISPPPDPTADDGSQATIIPPADEKQVRHRARKRADILRLLIAFPGARQIFFVPLYDSTSGCFIGSFAWSTSATRIFSTDNHLSYLIAFGHSVMSEVSRLNTLSADNAKGDFISNVSHELRSPLHGILASVEFLADTALDGFQRNLVDTVDICGRTLLDTIEHVLDFSKIKKFGQETVQPMGVVSDLDISAVIEEVLEGVHAGFEFNGLSSQGLADTTKSRRAVPSSPKETDMPDGLQFGVTNELLTVIIDIDFRDSWKFPTVPGTWRRLTMNIFGNALKYTHAGYIRIKLEARAISSVVSAIDNNPTERTMVTLTISDTGRGMSSDFLKTKVFMPFTQEDVTAPGTGLGMSIVKQIVDLSGGRIDIRSDLGKGTEIRLSLPLENCPPDPEAAHHKRDSLIKLEEPVEAVRRRAKGRTVTIRGFDDTLGSHSPLQLMALAGLKASIEKYVTEWFGLEIVSAGKTPDIVISDESIFRHSTVAESSFRSLIILCSNGARRNISSGRLGMGQTLEFASKPCGPHRLAKALLNCLDAEDASPIAIPEERVSLQGPHDGVVSPKDATLVTAGASSNARLIGDLQSSIGFSPTAINIIRLPASHTRSSITNTSRRPSMTKRGISSTSIASNASNSSQKLDDSTWSSPTNCSTEPSSVSSLSLLNPAEKIDPRIKSLSNEVVSPVRTPKMLLVEDNPVNMMLLATYMKKNKWDFEKAENGLLALQAFQRRPEGFDVIFMDVSMPIMTGYESTRHIRSVEIERQLAYDHQNLIQSPYLSSLTSNANSTSFPFHSPATPFSHNHNPSTSSTSSSTSKASSNSTSNSPSAFEPSAIDLHLQAPRLKLNSPSLIIALTGFSSQKDQEMAFEAGVDIFMTKPVRFREVGRILEGWVKSREREQEALGSSREKGVLDEQGNGAKRSG